MNRSRVNLLWNGKGAESPWLGLALVLLVGCGRPDSSQRPQQPDQVLDFQSLYAKHCAACHGDSGRMGPAPPLNDQLFLAIVSDAELKRVTAKGRPKTLMPAFAKEHGGTLTKQQIDALVTGIRREWQTQPKQGKGSLPSYRDVDSSGKDAATGNKENGAAVFAKACACCHGDQGQGSDAGAVNDRAFLALISDQALRRIVITGRPDLGMPDYRTQGDRPADFKPLSELEITDVVSFLDSWKKH